MLKQILSISDVKKLQVGDQLFDDPEYSLAKTYIIQNISDGVVYAIYENGYQVLKLSKADDLPREAWWILSKMA